MSVVVSKKQKFFPRCYEGHSPLNVGGGKVIYGGSCNHPAVDDADIYIGFDVTMKDTPRRFPWEKGEQILFPIIDQCPPKTSEHEQYRKMVEWVSDQLDSGRKVHCGCIGGHGRTGTFLVALVAYRKQKEDLVGGPLDGVHPFPSGADDPIKYVREHYCDKVVESQAQVDFLVNHYGCKKANPSKKSYASSGSSWTGSTGVTNGWGYSGGHKSQMGFWDKSSSTKRASVLDTGKALRGKNCLWNDRVRAEQ